MRKRQRISFAFDSIFKITCLFRNDVQPLFFSHSTAHNPRTSLSVVWIQFFFSSFDFIFLFVRLDIFVTIFLMWLCLWVNESAKFRPRTQSVILMKRRNFLFINDFHCFHIYISFLEEPIITWSSTTVIYSHKNCVSFCAVPAYPSIFWICHKIFYPHQSDKVWHHWSVSTHL